MHCYALSFQAGFNANVAYLEIVFSVTLRDAAVFLAWDVFRFDGVVDLVYGVIDQAEGVFVSDGLEFCSQHSPCVDEVSCGEP